MSSLWLWPPQIQCCTLMRSEWGQSIYLAQARAHAEVVVGKLASQHVQSSWVESRLPTSLVLVPPALQPAQGARLPCIGPQNWGRPICGSHHSLPRVGLHLCNLPVPLSPLPVTQIPTWLLSSLPPWLSVYLSYRLSCTRVLLPFFS